MKTLNIAISELDYNKFGLKDEKLSFSDLLEIVSRELNKQNLSKSIELAQKHDLSAMSMEEISYEVRAVRNNAKGNN